MMANALLLPAPPVRLAPSLSGAAAHDAGMAGARHAEEAAWIRGARAGDPDAFRRLVDRYRDLAYEVALRIVRSPEEAEEIAQDAFVRAWRALPGFREEARFSTWLYRIVTRRALDVAGSARVRAARFAAELDPETLPGPAAPAPALTDARRLDRILAGLEPVRRAIVTLYYLRERTVDEVAEIVEMPANTVKTHLHRARAELRRAWNRSLAQEGRYGLPRL
jgi:RNA polymerase sigma-70 factor (ECF subfamily)